MNFETFLFYLFASLALMSGIMVIGSRNPIYSVLFLIIVFFNSVGLLMLLGAEFLAMIFLIIYVGAIAVLFLFVVMMLNLKVSSLNENLLRYVPIGGLFGILFLIEMFLIIDTDFMPLFNILNWDNYLYNLTGLNESFIIWIDKFEHTTNLNQLGMILYTYYFYPFLLSGFILLIAMIGAIVLTMHHRTNLKKQFIYQQVNRTFESAIKLKN